MRKTTAKPLDPKSTGVSLGRTFEDLLRASRAFQLGLGGSRQGGGAFQPEAFGSEISGYREFARCVTSYAVQIGDEGLGLLAEPISLGTFHLLADAVVGEPTLLDIWRKCARFTNTVTSAPPISARNFEDRIVLAWGPFDPARVHPLFPFVQLLFFQRLTAWLTGRKSLEGVLHVHAMGAPHVADWAAILSGRVERSEFFGFSLPREQGQFPNIRDHRSLAELARRPAEYLLYVDDEPGLTERVRRILLTRPGEIVSLEAVSNLLHTSPRSLTRHLAAEGFTFTGLRTEVICEAAARLLGQSGLPIAEIARQLGFAEAASFNRLFKRCMGVAPSTYRRTMALTRIDPLS